MNKLTFLLAVSVFYGVFAHAQNYTETFQKVLIKETYVHNVITEPVFINVTEQVMRHQGHNMGATLFEAIEYVLIREAHQVLNIIPAQFAEVVDTIVVQEACGSAPARIRTYVREVLTHPEIVHYADEPAIYDTIRSYRVLINGTGAYVPPKYGTITRAVVHTPAYFTETDAPPTLELFTIKKCN